MSKELEELRRKLHEKMGGDAADIVFQAIVTAVDEKEFTCEVKRDDAVDYFDVRLRGLVNAKLKGFAFIPAIGSTVLVCRIGKSNETFVCQFTEVDKMMLTIGDKLSVLIDDESITMKADQATIKATTGGLTLTKGGSGLKKTLNDLLKAIQKLTVTTGVGPSGPPINIADFVKVQQDLSNYLEG